MTTQEQKDQCNPWDDFAPKARKPYTITKQRERWSDEEHTRFLEALKLHGRAWRNIEEHVGTKTAVQIRSHAQKFFSKVIRNSSVGDEADALQLTEIPPPRPKRKPLHPYPRKLVSPAKAGLLSLEKLDTSALEMTLEQDNQSPKSVLSDLSVGSITYNNGSSPPPSVLHPDNAVASEDEDCSLGEQMPQESCGRYFKLFGKILFIAEPDTSTSSSMRIFIP